MGSRTIHRPPRPRSLSDHLGEWVAAGLITIEQSHTIEQHEARRRERRAPPARTPAPERGPSLVVEALGYLGGVVMLVGALILVSLYWDDLSVSVRLVLIGAAAVVLIGAGFAVPDRLGEAAVRLRSVLWAAGVAATGSLLVVLCEEVWIDALDRYHDRQLVIGGGTAAVAAALWWLHRTWPQQLALFLPLMFAANGLGVQLTAIDSPGGGAVMWGVAVGWVVASWAGRLEPRATGVAFGVLGAVVGALSIHHDVGVALGLLTAGATVVLALWERSLAWLAVAALALLLTAPRAAGAWFPGRLSAALTFIVSGAVLVGAATWAARHRGPETRA